MQPAARPKAWWQQTLKSWGMGAGGGVRKEDTELLGKLNAAISALAADGTIQKITEKYPDLNGVLELPTK